MTTFVELLGLTAGERDRCCCGTRAIYEAVVGLVLARLEKAQSLSERFSWSCRLLRERAVFTLNFREMTTRAQDEKCDIVPGSLFNGCFVLGRGGRTMNSCQMHGYRDKKAGAALSR